MEFREIDLVYLLLAVNTNQQTVKIWSCGRLGELSVTAISSAHCYEYNFKGFVVGLIVGILLLY